MQASIGRSYSESGAALGRITRRCIRATLAAATCLLAGVACRNEAPANSAAPSTAKQAAPATAAAAVVDRAPPDKPHVIIVLIDTLRADHLGFMGYKRRPSPNLDAWAKESVVFDRAYSAAPWTVPSVASLFTSLYPSVHHTEDYQGRYISPSSAALGDVLPDEVETIAEAFRDNGYQTAAFVANTFLTPETNYSQGFQTYVPITKERLYAPASDALDRAAQWLGARDPAKPLFMYLHLMDVHQPYNAPRKFRDPFVQEVKQLTSYTTIAPSIALAGSLGAISAYTENENPALANRAEYWIARYDAGIAHVDDELARFRSTLERNGLWDKSVLIVTADHGESLYDQGGWDHGLSPFDHELHVPLLVHAPKHWPARRIGTTVSLMDVKPSLLEFAGIKTAAMMQGHSFASLLSGAAAPDAGFAFAEGVKNVDALKAAYQGEHKIIRDTKASRSFYFNLSRDPSERRRDPIPPDEPAAAALSSRLDAVLAENRAHESDFLKRQTPFSKKQVDKFRSLGYLTDGGNAPKGSPPPYGSFQIEPK